MDASGADGGAGPAADVPEPLVEQQPAPVVDHPAVHESPRPVAQQQLEQQQHWEDEGPAAPVDAPAVASMATAASKGTVPAAVAVALPAALEVPPAQPNGLQEVAQGSVGGGSELAEPPAHTGAAPEAGAEAGTASPASSLGGSSGGVGNPGGGGGRSYQRRTKWGRFTSDITLRDLEDCFHLPIEEASERLGVGQTVLKSLCRANNITRWPYRKVRRGKWLADKLRAGFGTGQDRSSFKKLVEELNVPPSSVLWENLGIDVEAVMRGEYPSALPPGTTAPRGLASLGAVPQFYGRDSFAMSGVGAGHGPPGVGGGGSGGDDLGSLLQSILGPRGAAAVAPTLGAMSPQTQQRPFGGGPGSGFDLGEVVAAAAAAAANGGSPGGRGVGGGGWRPGSGAGGGLAQDNSLQAQLRQQLVAASAQLEGQQQRLQWEQQQQQQQGLQQLQRVLSGQGVPSLSDLVAQDPIGAARLLNSSGCNGNALLSLLGMPGGSTGGGAGNMGAGGGLNQLGGGQGPQAGVFGVPPESERGTAAADAMAVASVLQQAAAVAKAGDGAPSMGNDAIHNAVAELLRGAQGGSGGGAAVPGGSAPLETSLQDVLGGQAGPGWQAQQQAQHPQAQHQQAQHQQAQHQQVQHQQHQQQHQHQHQQQAELDFLLQQAAAAAGRRLL